MRGRASQRFGFRALHELLKSKSRTPDPANVPNGRAGRHRLAGGGGRGGAPRVARIEAVRAKFRPAWARGEHITNAMGTHEI